MSISLLGEREGKVTPLVNCSTMNTSDEINNSGGHELHSKLIADARERFPTRAALEDAILECRAKIESVELAEFGVDKSALAYATAAEDGLGTLLPMRLLLPTVTELAAMMDALQMVKEKELKEFNIEQARVIQAEIDSFREQIYLEDHYLLQKRIDEVEDAETTKCKTCRVMFPPETKVVGILKLPERHCMECKEVAVEEQTVSMDSVTVSSSEDEHDALHDISEPLNQQQPRLEQYDEGISCGLKNLFVDIWW